MAARRILIHPGEEPNLEEEHDRTKQRHAGPRDHARARACRVCWASPRVEAQVATGTIVGTVKDAEGGAVAGATVTITEVNKGTRSTATTDATGSYNAPFLIPGAYEVAIEATGFKKLVRRGIVLQVNQRARVDASLALGTFAETTEVTALAPLTRSDSAEMGEVIEERAVRELPLNGRNFATLVYLAPGVTPGQAGENLSGASTFNPRGASNFNALGSQANTNAWLVDGIDNNEYTYNTVIVQPTVESVREFKVLTGTFSAEFGRGAGVVSVSTKSGNNELHGTAFGFLRNERFDAKDFFARPTAKKPPLDRHQFGAAISRPHRQEQDVLLRRLRRHQGGTRPDLRQHRAHGEGPRAATSATTATPPAPSFPSTTRSPPAPIRASTHPAGELHEPAAHPGPFPGNIIPANRLDQVGLQRRPASIPSPTAPATSTTTPRPTTARCATTTSPCASTTVRPTGTASSSASATTSSGSTLPRARRPAAWPRPSDAASRFDLGPYVAGIQNTRLWTMGAAFSWTRILGPTVVNEVRVGFAKTNPETRQSDYGHQAASSLGIQGINLSEATSGLPNLNIQDVTGISGGPAFLPVNPSQIHYQFEDSLAWVKNRHSFKTGYRLVWRKPSPFINDNTRSAIAINRNLTNNPATNTGGSGLATLLLGYTTGGSRGFILEVPHFTNSEHSFFVQDDWKVNSRLTLNLGLRYEIYVPDTEENDRLANFDPENNVLVYAGETADRRANKEMTLGEPRPAPGCRLGHRGERTSRGARRLRQELLPGASRGREQHPLERALHHLPELQHGDEPPRSLAESGAAAFEPLPRRCAREAHDHGGAERRQPAGDRPRLLQRDAPHADLAGQLRSARSRTR